VRHWGVVSAAWAVLVFAAPGTHAQPSDTLPSPVVDVGCGPRVELAAPRLKDGLALHPHLRLFRGERGRPLLHCERPAAEGAPLSDIGTNLGYQTEPAFSRVRLVNRGPDPLPLLLAFTTFPDHLHVYARPKGEPSFALQRTGRMVPAPKRPAPTRLLSVPLQVAAQSHLDVVIEVDSVEAYTFEPTLFTPTSFLGHSAQQNLVFGLYFGILLVMSVFNLVIFLLVNDRVYLLYVGFQVSYAVALFVGDQLGVQYLWPNAVVFNSHAELVAGGFAYFFGAAFTYEFLGLKGRFPKLAKMLQLYMALSVLVALSGVFTDSAEVKFVSLAFLLCIATTDLVVSIYVWMKTKEVNAAVFVVAWGMFYVSLCVASLFMMGAVAPHFITEHALKLGSATEATLLSLALAYRIRALQQQTFEAQSQLLEEREAHTAHLEDEVQARTSDLQTALDDLQQAQQQMVHQARLATLGQLVGGVAHEIGNPLNFSVGGTAEALRRQAKLQDALEHLPPADRGQLQLELDGLSTSLGLVQRGNERIRHILDTLRPLGPSSDGAQLRCHPSHVVRDTLALMERSLEGVDVHLALDDDVYATCAAGEANQILMNLTLNAMQAQEGADAPQLWIDVERKGDSAFIAVEDAGPGVNEDDRAEIFAPFFTTRAPGEGTGIGLFISRDLARARGGDLKLVKSKHADGARFQLQLPLALPEVDGERAR